MIIEVGKWKMRGGKMGVVVRRLGIGWQGTIDGHTVTWFLNGNYTGEPQTVHDFDLISPWEDSKTEDDDSMGMRAAPIKSESKMDVSIGDRALVECAISDIDYAEDMVRAEFGPFGHIWLSKDRLKSVEPAPPGVGDSVQWSGSGFPREIWGIQGAAVWLQSGDPDGFCDSFERMLTYPGFRVIKRAEPK